MDAGGGKRQHNVSLAHGGVVDNARLVHDAGAIARKVVILFRHQAGVLGGLAADERRAGLHTALGYAADNLSNLFRDVLAAGNVIQEKQRFRPAADDIVDAHRHRINADGVVLVHQNGQFHLGAATVGAGYQHRLGHAGQV